MATNDIIRKYRRKFMKKSTDNVFYEYKSGLTPEKADMLKSFF